jgi:hypothetical protein
MSPPATDNANLVMPVAELHRVLIQLGYAISARERKDERHGADTRRALESFQAEAGLEPTGELDSDASTALYSTIAANTYTVTGAVLSPSLPGIEDLAVRLVDKNVGGDVVLATTESATGGAFSLSVVVSPRYLAEHKKAKPDLQVQALTDDTVLAASEVEYSAPQILTLDVHVPASAEGIPSEYETLTSRLAAAYSGNLAELQEDSSRQDITYLANKTGWDARAVALVSLAWQFSEIAVPEQPAPGPTPKASSKTRGRAAASAEEAGAPAGKTAKQQPASATVAPEFYYALFRAGLPANPEALFQVSPATVQSVWQQAIEQGVIPRARSKDVSRATKTFQALAVAKTLTGSARVGVSSFTEMLQGALPDLGQQEQFVRLYTQYGEDPETLWPAVQKALGAATAGRLQSLGRFYYLTLNNQPLVAALTKATSEKGATPLGTPIELATRGYYQPSAWAPLITPDAIPPEVPGEGAAERASNYADLLAAQVKLAYPTAVLADQVRQALIPVAGGSAVATEVAAFLNSHQEEFEIGAEPVDSFIARASVNRPSDAVLAQVKRLQRTYQLTPDDTSMAVLLEHNLDSAYAVTRYDRAGFTRAFSAKLGGEETAGAVHARAQVVFSSVLNIATEYLKSHVGVAIGGTNQMLGGSPSTSGQPPASVVAYPTLETLFGHLDYCSCSDCSSILSPAAYFVDLLHFIDQPAPRLGLENSQDALFARRPDLQFLDLTCANTNTALPYIDIVNETLEYFVANGLSIDGYEGRNTDDELTSAELVASPQFVNDDAYKLLAGTYFPPPLPFNRPLTLMRLQLQAMGIDLPAAMEALRTNDLATNETSPTDYGWRDILIERLGISREEWQVLTDETLTLGQLYGLPAGPAQQLPTLQSTSLQQFSRRLNVSYEDLVAIVQTQFINPNASLIPLLEGLNCSFATIEQVNGGTGTQAFLAGLPAGLDATGYGASTPEDRGAVLTWIHTNYARIMDVITISKIGDEPGDCSGADLFLEYVNPAAPQLSEDDFRRLIRFIRLWRRLTPLLGESEDAATISDTDQILTALLPAGAKPGEAFEALLMRLGFLFQAMGELSLTADSELDQLLACWSPIGTLGPESLYASMFLTPTLLEQDPGAQTATVSSTVGQGDLLTTSFNAARGAAATVEYAVLPNESPEAVATAIAVQVNASTARDPATAASGEPAPYPNAMEVGERYLAVAEEGAITIKAGFKFECETTANAAATYSAPTVAAQSLAATLGGAVGEKDKLTTTINGVQVDYEVLAGATLETIAAGIAAAINAATELDPLSGKQIKEAFTAVSNGPTVTITQTTGAGFTLQCSISRGAQETYTSESPVCRRGIVGGAFRAGDQLKTLINTVPIAYTVLGSETMSDIGERIADAINASTLPDPYSGLPLNELVVATGAGSTVTVLAANAGAPYELDCSLAPPATGTAQASSFVLEEIAPARWTATLGSPGAIKQGDTFVTTINEVEVTYSAGVSDTDVGTLAASIAAAIGSSKTIEPSSGLALSAIVQAAGSTEVRGAQTVGVVTVTATEPANLTITAEVTQGKETYDVGGPEPESAVAVLTGTPPTGAVATITINGIPILYTVKQGDTGAAIAAGLAASIAAPGTVDASGHALSTEVATAVTQLAGGEQKITITATSPATTFSLDVALTASGYTAGRRTPPFASGGSGEYLTDATQTLFGHEPTICAACHITGPEFQLIAKTLKYGPSSQLTLESVSGIFRYAWLARTLGLSVAELLGLLAGTGLKPFDVFDASVTPVVEPALVRLIRMLGALEAAGLEGSQVLYEIWNEDLTGTLAPSREEMAELAVALRAEFTAVEASFVLREDPTGSLAQSLMALVYGSSTAGFFFGLLNNTFTTSVPYSAPAGLSGLPPAVLDASSGLLSYANLTKQLTFAGRLNNTIETDIEAAITVKTSSTIATAPGPATVIQPLSMVNIYPETALVLDTGPAEETVLVKETTATTFTATTAHAHNTPFQIVSEPKLAQAVAELANANAQALAPFFASYPELEPLYLAYEGSKETPQIRRTELLEAFLPIFVSERKREQALSSVTSAAGTDQSFATALLGDPSILHADADRTAPAVSDFMAIDRGGLSAEFFLTNDLSAPADEQADCVPDLAYMQTAEVTGAGIPGEALTTTIDGVAVPYTVGAFSLECSVAGAASEKLTAASQSPVSKTVTVSDTAITPGDMLTVTLDGVPVPYTVAANDTAEAIALNIADAINATTVTDQIAAAPLNRALAAESNGTAVTVKVVPAGAGTESTVIAGGIAAAINAETATVNGTALNQLVTARVDGSTIAIASTDPSTMPVLTLVCTAGASNNYKLGTELPAPTAGGTVAAVFSGYITAPQSGVYAINIASDSAAAIKLEIDGEEVLAPGVNGLWSNNREISLQADVLVPIVLTAESLSTTLVVSWQSQGSGWQPIPSQYLYSLALVNRMRNSYVRFLKAASLADTLSLSAEEIAYLGTETSHAVNTMGASETTAGITTFTPTSMVNIAPQTALVVDGPQNVPDPTSGIDSVGAEEQVTVEAITATSKSFTAPTALDHHGTIPIVSVSSARLGQGWINSLSGDPAAQPAVTEQVVAENLGDVLVELLDFARMKRLLRPGDSRLLAVLKNPELTLANGNSALLSLTGWSQSSLTALLARFFPDTGIKSLSAVESLKRIYDAFEVVSASRLSASTLLSAVTNAPSPTTASTFQAALRSRYSATDWLAAVTPISNAARIAQRDALVAYVLQQMGDRDVALLTPREALAKAPDGSSQIKVGSVAGAALTAGMSVTGTGIPPGTKVTTVISTPPSETVTLSQPASAAIPANAKITFTAPGPLIRTVDDLYALLMIDADNEPPVMTSRILLATLTVQLFIERVIRNLEPTVSPTDISKPRWTWMKRYRVWQANREVFLWPENWLYPQLRDDQSPFFEQTMSALLQGDIDAEAARNAYLDYLTNLEEVAKLEACGMYYEPAQSGTDETVYVVSRTAGAHRKHYFRELSGASWNPWREVKIDCEDLPLTPIVWDGRLFLFWLKITKERVPLSQTLSATTAETSIHKGTIADFELQQLRELQTGAAERPQVAIGAALCWSEYYNGKWQPTKTSDLRRPTSFSNNVLGYLTADQADEFERDARTLLRIVPSWMTPPASAPDALILAITEQESDQPLGGFMFHNSHSLPVALEELYTYYELPKGFGFGLVSIGLFSQLEHTSQQPLRELSPVVPYTGANVSDGLFRVTYTEPNSSVGVSNDVLGYEWMPRFVQPQPGYANPADGWDAPFIYENRRHIFYVRRSETVTVLPEVTYFGARPPILRKAAAIEALRIPGQEAAPSGQGTSAPGLSLLDGKPKRGGAIAALPSSSTVSFDGQAIGMRGSMPESSTQDKSDGG